MENKEIMVFGKTFEETEVEMIIENGEPLFEVYSTGMALGYMKYNSVGKPYPAKDRTDKILENAEIKPCVHGVHKYITESQLYDFMLEARTEKCRMFRNWITSEVIPSIRKTGGYIMENSPLAEHIASLRETVTVLQNQVLALSPVVDSKKINVWKSQYIKPIIKELCEKFSIDDRCAYDMVYNRMGHDYGFSRYCAMSEFCTRYRIENCSVADAVADDKLYRQQFVITSNRLLSSKENTKTEPMSPDEIFRSAIKPLVEKHNDKSANIAKTFGKVYKAMRSDRSWCSLMNRRKCRSKKELILVKKGCVI